MTLNNNPEISWHMKKSRRTYNGVHLNKKSNTQDVVEQSLTVQDIHGIYLVSSKELEESLIEGVRNLDAAANELLDGICLFCSTQELRYLTDAELIETIYAQ